MRITLLSFSLMASYFLFGQQPFKKGWIVNNSGDTIHGYIQGETEELLEQSITFKDPAGATKVMSVGDLKEFGFDGENVFRSVNYIDPLDSLKSKTHFAKFMLQGEYQLFSFQRKDDLYFIVSTKDTSYLLYDDVKTHMGEVIERGNYQSLLSFFARECSKVSSTTANTEFSERALLSFFVSLEKCRNNLNGTVIHYSKSKFQKNIILFAGGFQIDKHSEILVQALGQFVLPSINEKASLMTGFVYLRNTHESTETYTLTESKNKYATQMFEVPVLFRYDLLSKAIRPYLYGGMGMVIRKDKETSTQVSLISPGNEATGSTAQTGLAGTVILGGGLAIRITKGLFVGFDWRYDLLSHLPVLGLGYKISL
jgi:hypothetical protein